MLNQSKLMKLIIKLTQSILALIDLFIINIYLLISMNKSLGIKSYYKKLINY